MVGIPKLTGHILFIIFCSHIYDAIHGDSSLVVRNIVMKTVYPE
jgi:hypothetical protein